jgi:methylated-DNA-[protein]-cysteine S-methyltransferase
MNAHVFGVPLAIDGSIVAASREEIRRRVAAYERAERGEQGSRNDWSSFDLEVGYSEGFTGSVMHGMAKIPCGETRTYGEIAAALDTAPVAVGGACGRNPGPADRALSPRRRGGLAGWVLRRRGSRTRVEAPPPRSRTRAGRDG